MHKGQLLIALTISMLQLVCGCASQKSVPANEAVAGQTALHNTDGSMGPPVCETVTEIARTFGRHGRAGVRDVHDAREAEEVGEEGVLGIANPCAYCLESLSKIA